MATIVKLRTTATTHDETARRSWRGEASTSEADRCGEVSRLSAANPYVLQKERRVMKEAAAKQKLHGGGLSATMCLNPVAGQEQVIAYIVGDLSEEARRDFVAHVTECRYCLEEVVLWRISQVLAESDQPLKADSASN